MSKHGRLMSDGTRCFSGPDCRRHSGNQKGVKKAEEKLHILLNSLKKAVPSEASDLGYEAWDIEDAVFSPERRVIRGENTPDKESRILGQLNAESILLRNMVSKDLHNSTVRGYISNYEYLNLSLRFGKVEGIERYLDTFYDPESMKNDETRSKYYGYVDSRVEEMDAVFSEWGSRPEGNVRRLYRSVRVDGLGFGSAGEYAASLKPGDVICEDSYTSTTADSDVMLIVNRPSVDKGSERIVVYEILSREGLPLYEADGFSFSLEEREVLLNRGSSFRVHNVVERTFESTYPGGFSSNPQFSRNALKRCRFTVVQLEHVTS